MKLSISAYSLRKRNASLAFGIRYSRTLAPIRSPKWEESCHPKMGKERKKERRIEPAAVVLLIHINPRQPVVPRPIKDTRAFVGRTSREKRAFASERR